MFFPDNGERKKEGKKKKKVVAIGTSMWSWKMPNQSAAGA